MAETRFDWTSCGSFHSKTQKILQRFDALILHKLHKILDLIDQSRQVITENNNFEQKKALSYGLSLGVAWPLNLFSNWLENNRSLTNFNGDFTDVLEIGMIIFYGIANQKSRYLGAIPDPEDSRTCFTVDDFYAISQRFGGINLPTCQKILPRLNDFELVLKSQMQCLLQESYLVDVSAELTWNLDEFLSAVYFRNEIIGH